MSLTVPQTVHIEAMNQNTYQFMVKYPILVILFVAVFFLVRKDNTVKSDIIE